MTATGLIQDKNLPSCIKERDSSLVDFLMVTGNVFDLVIDIKKKKFLHISNSIVNVTGFYPEQLESETLVYLNDIRNILKKAVRFHYSRPKADRTKYKYTSCLKFRHNEGHYIWLLYHFMFIKHDEKGKPELVMITATDITHIKQNKGTFLSISKYDAWNNCFETARWESCLMTDNLVLVNKEYDIIRLIAQGYDTKQIAEIVRLSKYTVEDYRKRLIRKLDARNIYQVIKRSKEFGVI